MKSAKKDSSAILVGEKFLVLWDSNHYPVQIEVLSKLGDEFQVKFSTPATPKTCDRCGHGRNLSLNAITGVVVCMTTGCGGNFGYQEVTTTKMKASDLVPIRKRA